MEFTIGQLAEEAGLTVRNIRLFQTRGLLPKPELRGREAVYTEAHLERLRLIRRLQAEGLSRTLIEQMLRPGSDPLVRLAEARDAVVALNPPPPDQPTVETLEQLIARFGAEPAALTAGLERGIVVAREDGAFDVPHPAQLDLAQKALALGLSLDAVFQISDLIVAQAAQTATFLVDIIVREVWEPFDRAGRPAEEWEATAEKIQQSHPLALELYEQFIPPAIAAEVEAVTASMLARDAVRHQEAGEG